ncbi:MAG: hypothetical protein OXH19_04190 [Chloroflexi bacterium]|nr:hypothetical protein [Chloroflexota bacterium]MCY3588232.1 hypothetical protein [Chloroflexota bacterium]MCY3687064.1 hypothetical protein [Chloroflexota bacterium]MDE2708632.1 hypothetical protein [Chloroflexota bacterium]
MVTTSSPEVAMQQMVDELVEQFDPEKVYLLDVLMSGDQRVWHQANFLVVLEGEWDYRDKVTEIMGAMPRTGFDQYFRVITPERFERYRGNGYVPPHFDLNESRKLYERK